MKYIRYIIKNVEPLRIADDSTSQSGQTVTLRYIPGTTIRGYVVNQLANTLEDKFEQYKKALISDQVIYMNAYLYENGKELFPSPKGFYENKAVVAGKKEIENVVINGEFTPGNKRAGLGRFCYFEDQCIHYYNVETSSDMKILINKRKSKDKQNVFRNEYITAGHSFVGYIKANDDDLIKDILEILEGTLALGNSRSQGLGKCKVIEVKEMSDDFIPFQEYAVEDDAVKSCYMMLLSNTAMRNDAGEYIGLNLKWLEKKLGVSNLYIEYCSTSTVNVKGYNRVWGSKIPSVTMYEQGSVFKLCYEGSASLQNMQNIMQSGIGIRICEGFGRVLFLKDYKCIQFKMEGAQREISFDDVSQRESDLKDIKIIATNYYRKMLYSEMQKRILDGVDCLDLAKSQIGNVRSLIEANRYDAIRGTEVVKEYFSHSSHKEENKKIQKQKASIALFRDKVLSILEQPLIKTLELEDVTHVMEIAVERLISTEDLQRMKFDYILDLIKYDNRKVAR